MSWSRRLVITLLAAGCLTGATSQLLADAPDDLTIIVPLGSGGALDKMARHMAEHLTRRGEYDVSVENRVIKGTSDGYRDFLERPADGSTVLAWFEPAVSKYDGQFSYDDLSIINIQEIEPPILGARGDLGWRSLDDLIKAAQERPGTIRIGAGKAGGNLLLLGRQFEELGIDIEQVDYASGGKARQGLLNNEIELTIGSLKAMKKLGDAVVPLAVMAPRRLRLWPEVPSIAEAVEPYGATAIYGASYRFFAVRKDVGTDHPAALERLTNAMKDLVLEDDAFKERYGGVARWFGKDDSRSLLSRANAQFKSLKAPRVRLATQPKR